MRPDTVHIPYCGLPPLPVELWSRWTLDPALWLFLLLVVLTYDVALSAAKRRGGAIAPGGVAAFHAGWLVLAAALVSPLCALSVSLFSARVGQHMVLVLVAAPLLMLGRPLAVLRAALGQKRLRRARSRDPAPALGASAAFTLALWLWHMPGPYAATFSSDLVYWTMHATMIASALWLWSILLDRRPARAVTVIATGLLASLQMSLLGAAITFAGHPLYAPHATTTAAWGLGPLLDQQLGGAIMWVPGGVIFLAAAMTALWSLLATARERPYLRTALR